MGGQQHVLLDDKASGTVTDWMFQTENTSTCQHHREMQHRFTLVGLLFGAEQQVLAALIDAAAPQNNDYLTPACRALINLNDYLTPFSCVLRERVAKQTMRIMKDLKKTGGNVMLMGVRSSYAGLLGSVGRESVKRAKAGEAAE